MTIEPGCTGETLADWQLAQAQFARLQAQCDVMAKTLAEQSTQLVFPRPPKAR